MSRQSGRAWLERELESLSELDRSELIKRFVGFYHFEPPPRFSRKLMVLAVAYKMQEKVYGGLKPSTRRLLIGPVSAATAVKRVRARAKLKPGTILIREWQGVTHQVTVSEEGFLHLDKQYRSLSELARTITGTHWSGPTFFGLKKLAPADHERQ